MSKEIYCSVKRDLRMGIHVTLPNIYTYIHIHIYIYTHTHTHTTHTHTHTLHAIINGERECCLLVIDFKFSNHYTAAASQSRVEEEEEEEEEEDLFVCAIP